MRLRGGSTRPLARQAGELGSNVEALLVAVKATNDFETEMAERFGGGKDAPAEVLAVAVCDTLNINPKPLTLKMVICSVTHSWCYSSKAIASSAFRLECTMR